MISQLTMLIRLNQIKQSNMAWLMET